MDTIKGIFCRLCLTDITNKNFLVAKYIIREILSVVFLGLILDESDNYIICSDCYLKLTAAFNFKVMCLETEDLIFPYVNSYVDAKKATHIDLRAVYLKEKEEIFNITLEQQVCRLCMKLVCDGYVLLEQVCDSNVIDKFIPEVNRRITKDPVICKQCSDALGVHINFIKASFYVQGKIKDSIRARLFKIDDIDIEFDELHEDRKGALYELSVQNEVEHKDPAIKQETGGSLSSFKHHLIHEAPSKRLIHTDPSEVQTYKCDKCDYQTTRKDHLTVHQIIHKDLSEVQMHKCNKCEFQTKRKWYLVRHQLIHTDPSEVRMYKCDKCDYQTKRKDQLALHQIIHKDLSEVQMHKCNKCEYQTKRKWYLVRHQLIHTDPSEVRMYKCDKCDHQTKWKDKLPRHQLIHKDLSEVQMYKCDKCDYQAKRKDRLTEHQIIHKDSSEAQMYKRGKYDYQAKRKDRPHSASNNTQRLLRTSSV